jgi:hypothetical protein
VGEYYEVRVDGASVGAAYFNDALRRWECAWDEFQGGNLPWQIFLMASDHRTPRYQSPVWHLIERQVDPKEESKKKKKPPPP